MEIWGSKLTSNLAGPYVTYANGNLRDIALSQPGNISIGISIPPTINISLVYIQKKAVFSSNQKDVSESAVVIKKFMDILINIDRAITGNIAILTFKGPTKV
ncbi:hypothetical protein [Caldanaerobius fijiensis]|uniref:hypothetical protein n=1 Tax=Caldanaerobius fijiensis TaxID=456330 RepID=UPI001F3088FD|nr:hypothetical protein [Caldanaerobius fijiensis]